MGTLLNRRRYMGGKSLPYDAEIEYLESTNERNERQWINTGFIVKSQYVVECRVLLKSVSGSGMIFCAGWNDALRRYGLNKTTYYYYGNKKGYFTPKFEDNTIYDIQFGNNTIQWNNNSFNIGYTGDTFTSVEPLALLGTFSGSYLTLGRYYFLKLKDENGQLILDLIPVRVGTTGYLYDKVSGQLFGNAGTGDFILGPDKN
jgi:hypothetical protein